MPFEGNNHDLADALQERKLEIEKLAFALALYAGDRTEIDPIVIRINGWIDEACEILRSVKNPYEKTARQKLKEAVKT